MNFEFNKNTIRTLITAAVIIIVYNLLAFLIPFKHGTIFWLAYVFGFIAIIVGLLVFALAYGGDHSARSRFYGTPIAAVGLYYAIAQVVISFITMAVGGGSSGPAWPFLLISILLLAAAILGTVATDFVRDEVRGQDEVLKKNVENIRALRSLGSSLVAQCTDEEAKKELKKLADTLNYCDPVSNDATIAAENELDSLLQEIQRAIVDGDNASIAPLCKKASNVLAERNRLCKLNK